MLFSQSPPKELPPFVVRKLQRIATDNEIQACTLSPNRMIACDPGLILLSQWNRTWVYSGGMVWILCSDGDLFIEPAELEPAEAFSVQTSGEVWVITLDDAAEELTVSRLIFPAEGAPSLLFS